MTVRVSDGRLDVARRGHATDATLRHLLLDQVGRLVVHADAVLIEGRATLLVGATGAGKSTLAARLLRFGHAVLADDGVLVQEGRAGLVVFPSYARLRLYEDSAAAGYRAIGGPLAEYSAKRRFPAATSARSPRAPLPLGPVYILEPSEAQAALHVAPLSRREATVALLHHAYRADLADRAALRAQFDTLSEWSSRLAAWRLRLPRRLDAVADVAAALADHARRQAARGAPEF